MPSPIERLFGTQVKSMVMWVSFSQALAWCHEKKGSAEVKLPTSIPVRLSRTRKRTRPLGPSHPAPAVA